jgi:hypothetical protein
MNNILLAAVATAFFASPVLAQTRVIVVDPVETGSTLRAPVDPSVPGSSTASPHTRTQGNNVHTGSDLVPSFQQGSSQESGGPANELNSSR